jgi:ferric-dicitrate binding protein FerR (iron transport regulator)
MENNRVFELFERYHKGIASQSETEELMLLLKTLPDEKLAEILLRKWNDQNLNEVFFTSDAREKFLNRLQPAEELEAVIHHLGPTRRKFFLRIAAAAAILLVLSSTAFFLFKKDNREIAQSIEKPPVTNDIAPGGDKAILTLADGRQIILDTASDGAIAQQGGIRVIKKGGKLSYASTAGGGQEKVLYNTISTPKGGQYHLVLADGSQVWLNATSSLHFPTSFMGKERRVEVSGEAYFEVAKNKNMPFHVNVNGAEIQVLGTHFNIMAYQDETAIKTTLLEGSVKFVSGSTSSLLRPGQQSQCTKEGHVHVMSGVDVDQVVAWKNGMFYFENADIGTVMRQLSRWYDVDVVYQSNNIKHLFVGKMPRSSKLSDVLKVLELTSTINFEIEGRKIIVKP